MLYPGPIALPKPTRMMYRMDSRPQRVAERGQGHKIMKIGENINGLEVAHGPLNRPLTGSVEQRTVTLPGRGDSLLSPSSPMMSVASSLVPAPTAGRTGAGLAGLGNSDKRPSSWRVPDWQQLREKQDFFAQEKIGELVAGRFSVGLPAFLVRFDGDLHSAGVATQSSFYAYRQAERNQGRGNPLNPYTRLEIKRCDYLVCFRDQGQIFSLRLGELGNMTKKTSCKLLCMFIRANYGAEADLLSLAVWCDRIDAHLDQDWLSRTDPVRAARLPNRQNTDPDRMAIFKRLGATLLRKFDKIDPDFKSFIIENSIMGLIRAGRPLHAIKVIERFKGKIDYSIYYTARGAISDRRVGKKDKATWDLLSTMV